MNLESSILTKIAAGTAACHWLPTGERLGEGQLADLLSFVWGLPTDGLPFQARSREDRAALELLRRRGLVAIQGATSGVHVRLTPEGGACFWRLDKAAATAGAIAERPTVKTTWGADVILGCELCPTAGDWWQTASASDGAWGVYLTELAAVQTALKPLFVLGWAVQYVARDQRIWAVELTATGRDAVAMPPQIEPDAGFVFDADLWRAAWRDAAARYSANPPDCGGALVRFLPASKWPTAQEAHEEEIHPHCPPPPQVSRNRSLRAWLRRRRTRRPHRRTSGGRVARDTTIFATADRWANRIDTNFRAAVWQARAHKTHKRAIRRNEVQMHKQPKPTPKSVIVNGLKLNITAPAPASTALPANAEADRADWALRGVSRCIQRAAASGATEAVIDEAQKLFEAASDHLDAWRAAVKAFADVPDPADPLRQAQIAAADELRKRLPVAFPSQGDALTFASRLSFAAAAAEGAARMRQRELADRTRQDARKLFWLAVEQAAQLIGTIGKGTDRALDVIVENGRYE